MRLGELERVALADGFVHAARPAPGVRLELHSQAVDAGEPGSVGERVLAHQAVGKVHVHVGAGLEARELSRHRGELERGDALGGQPLASDGDLQLRRPAGHSCCAGPRQRLERRGGPPNLDPGARRALKPSPKLLELAGVVAEDAQASVGGRSAAHHRADHAAAAVDRLHEVDDGLLGAAGPCSHGDRKGTSGAAADRRRVTGRGHRLERPLEEALEREVRRSVDGQGPQRQGVVSL